MLQYLAFTLALALHVLPLRIDVQRPNDLFLPNSPKAVFRTGYAFLPPISDNESH